MMGSSPAVTDHTSDVLFYDGHCGLCHGIVKFVIARDPEGTLFRYAPLDGPTFEAAVPGDARGNLPDSVAVRTADGRLLVRSTAAIHIGERLGGIWRGLARIVAVMPRWLLDLGYDAVARIRSRLFARPDATCPILPAELRQRFLP
jgi:predicted DCC family thiol-disulfide oxidoreductase YuxK